MNRIRRVIAGLDLYDWLAFAVMAFILAMAITYWHKFPVHMDMYYHVGVTSGYSSAGGIALHSFWEFAPAGRAQLYPPLLHVLMFTLTKFGLSIVTVARLVSFAAFPLLTLSSWYGVRKIFSTRAAFYCTVLLSSIYLLFWHSAVESAASLVLILTPLIFVAVDRNKKVAAAVLLALALYSHLTLGHLVALGLLLYAVHRRQMFKEIIEVLAGAYLLWLPWGIQILTHYKSLGFDSSNGAGVTVHILIWAVALAGFAYCYFKKGKYYLLPCFLLGFIPIVFFYPDRFWNAHVFVPLAMLGAVALSGLHGFLAERLTDIVHSRAVRVALVTVAMAIPVALFLLVDPVYSSGGGGVGGGPAFAGQPPGQQQTQQQQGTQQFGTSTQNQTTQISTSKSGTSSSGTTTAQAQNGNGMPQPPSGGTIQPPGQQNGTGGPPGAQGMGGGPGSSSSGLSRADTTLLSLINGSVARGSQSLSGESVISSDLVKLAKIVKANTTKDQIVYVTDGGLGNCITGLTGRASTSGMFHEVKSDGSNGSSASNATLIIVSSGQGGGAMSMGGPGTQGQIIDTSNYKPVGTTGSYSVYLNSSATARVTSHGTVIPWYVVYSLLFLALAAILIDWFRPGGKKPGPDEGVWDIDGAPHPEVPTDGTDAYLDTFKSEPPTGGSVLAIVPCYNEAENVGEVVAELRRVAPFVDVLVVDDGSVDCTTDAALRAGATVMSHRGNAGVGAAVRTGMVHALERGYSYAIQVDGDRQHNPSYILPLLEPLQVGTADVAIGSRFLGTDGYKPPFLRRIGTTLLSNVVTRNTGQLTWDTTSGFRAMNVRALEFLVHHYPNGYAETESLVLMHMNGIRWVEVPVVMRVRARGASSIRGFRSLAFMAKVLLYIALDVTGIRFPNKSTPADPVPEFASTDL